MFKKVFENFESDAMKASDWEEAVIVIVWHWDFWIFALQATIYVCRIEAEQRWKIKIKLFCITAKRFKQFGGRFGKSREKKKKKKKQKERRKKKFD